MTPAPRDSPQRNLILGSAFHVLEHESWNAPPGHLAQIRNVERLLNVTAAGGPAAPGHVVVMSGQ